MKFNGMVLGVVMQLIFRDNLIFVDVTISYQGTTLDMTNILVDTGSATTILAKVFKQFVLMKYQVDVWHD